ncbi:uncharacterized protein LOC102808781 [Saccoglossus kowalevskii]|uniref:Uncharacterized protein LOC102808781 n=1 Tax=Saccoglossus kowalevskii TaxID=10224 RepID=A0ABM0MVL4_SACKO|nr:PREDICTED: uncharacterized protein LOC102808781 [Saccoglossus kowalevskii]
MIQNFQVREGSIIVTYELVMIDGADVSLVDMAQLMESEIKSGNLKLSYKNHDLPLDLESVEFDMQRADSTKGGKSNNTTVIACVAVLLVLCAVAAVVGVLVYRRQCRPGGSSGAKYVRSLNGPEVSFSNDSYDVPGGASQI